MLQREAADAQYRVVGEVEDLARAALRFHRWGSEGPGGDRPRSLWLRQQDGAQAQRPDHGRQGENHPPLCDHLLLSDLHFSVIVFPCLWSSSPVCDRLPLSVIVFPCLWSSSPVCDRLPLSVIITSVINISCLIILSCLWPLLLSVDMDREGAKVIMDNRQTFLDSHVRSCFGHRGSGWSLRISCTVMFWSQRIRLIS